LFDSGISAYTAPLSSREEPRQLLHSHSARVWAWHGISPVREMDHLTKSYILYNGGQISSPTRSYTRGTYILAFCWELSVAALDVRYGFLTGINIEIGNSIFYIAFPF